MSLSTIAARVDRNALLYKDVTQWLRHGLFMGLTFGLLLTGLFVLILAAGVEEKPGAAGPLALANLFRALNIYMLAVAAYGYVQALGEHRSGTLELYALSGITSDEVIMGKLGSLLAQALFGICALAPFMFFAYLLRGVDFLRILIATLLLLAWQPPLHLTALGLAYWTARSRAFSTLIAVAGAGLILLAGAGALAALQSSIARGYAEFARGSGLIARELVELKAGGLFYALIGAVAYFVACFMFFIFCKVGLDGALRAFVFAEWVMIRKASTPPCPDAETSPRGRPQERAAATSTIMMEGR